MERILTHPVLSSFFVLISLAFAWSWQTRADTFEGLLPENAGSQTRKVSPSFSWLQEQLGILPKTAPAVRIDAFEGAALEGWELLDSISPLAVATQTELARWTGPGRLPLTTKSVSISAVEGHPALEISLHATGDEPEVLAWLDHLLNAPPGNGYLTDPAQVRLISQSDNQLALELAIRVWPASVFLRNFISTGAQ